MLKLTLFIEDEDSSHPLDNDSIIAILKFGLFEAKYQLKSYIVEDVIDIEIIDAE